MIVLTVNKYDIAGIIAPGLYINVVMAVFIDIIN